MAASGVLLVGCYSNKTTPSRPVPGPRQNQTSAQQVTGVAFSPDGATLAASGEDRTVRLWDVATQKNVVTFQGHGAEVLSVAFSPDGTMLASADEVGVVKLWEVASESEKHVLRAPARVYSVAFAPSGKTLATAGSAGGFVVHGKSALNAGTPAPPPGTELERGPLRLWDVTEFVPPGEEGPPEE